MSNTETPTVATTDAETAAPTCVIRRVLDRTPKWVWAVLVIASMIGLVSYAYNVGHSAGRFEGRYAATGEFVADLEAQAAKPVPAPVAFHDAADSCERRFIRVNGRTYFLGPMDGPLETRWDKPGCDPAPPPAPPR